MRIDVNTELHVKADTARAALAANNGTTEEPVAMALGDQLVRVVDGKFRTYDVDSLGERLAKVAEFGRTTKKGEWTALDPPDRITRVVLASPSELELPAVERIVNHPVLTHEGLATRPGYHPESKLYYAPSPGLDTLRAEPPEMIDDVVEARSLLLDDLLGDFDFADEASKAHTLALLLLPFVRDAIAGPTPLHLFLAHQPNSGKTWCAKAALFPSLGEHVPMAPGGGGSDDEWRKQITSILLRGPSAVIFDNLSGLLDYPSLANVLTSSVWNDRKLGASEWVEIPVRNAWVATANNLDMHAEQVRRAVPVLIDPGDREPAGNRSVDEFRHHGSEGLWAWAKKSRADLVQAALTLVTHWEAGDYHLDASGHYIVRTGEGQYGFGSKPTRGLPYEWAQTMAGILAACDVPGFLDNLGEFANVSDDTTRESAEFLRAWLDLSASPLRFKELLQLCLPIGELHDAVPVWLREKRDMGTHLATWLRDNNGTRIEGMRVVHDGGRPRRWSIAESYPGSTNQNGDRPTKHVFDTASTQ